MGARMTHDLGVSADLISIQREGVRHYEGAMYSRSAIDASILKAAGADADQVEVAAEGARLSQEVEVDLHEARERFV